MVMNVMGQNDCDDTKVKSTMNWDYRKSNTDYFNNNTKKNILKLLKAKPGLFLISF